MRRHHNGGLKKRCGSLISLARVTKNHDEARRQFYVSMTRARKIVMYFTDLSHWKNSFRMRKAAIADRHSPRSPD